MGKIIKGKEQLTLPFGDSGWKLNGKPYNHEGIDVVKQWYSPDTIIAFAKGKVEGVRTNSYIGEKNTYGNWVMIDHENGYKTFYAHFKSVKVKKGQEVRQGQILGEMGMTGEATGVHLHFEIHKNGKLIDPTEFVFGNKKFEEPKKPVNKDKKHIVKKGDTLSEIAVKYNTTVKKLVADNKIKNPDLIHVGDTIVIKEVVPATPPKQKGIIYTIRPGDTLYDIARKFDTTVRKLAKDNNISNPDLIYSGNKLKILR